MTISDQFNQVLRDWSETFMRRSMHDFVRFSKESGLSMAQFNTLFRLHHAGICGVTEVGDHLGVTNAAASQAVDRLVVLGMIERTEDPDDRRTKRLALTQPGRATMEKGIEVRSQWVEGITDDLNPEQQEMIISALNLLSEAAKKTNE